jgi:hypothetical protein
VTLFPFKCIDLQNTKSISLYNREDNDDDNLDIYGEWISSITAYLNHHKTVHKRG